MEYEYRTDSAKWETVFDEEYIITYTTTDGKTIRIVKYPYFKKPKEPELQAGDAAALDAFLGGFASA